MTGAIMTETIFAWPGIGRYAVESAANLDYPAVLGTTLLIAVIYILINLWWTFCTACLTRASGR